MISKRYSLLITLLLTLIAALSCAGNKEYTTVSEHNDTRTLQFDTVVSGYLVSYSAEPKGVLHDLKASRLLVDNTFFNGSLDTVFQGENGFARFAKLKGALLIDDSRLSSSIYNCCEFPTEMEFVNRQYSDSLEVLYKTFNNEVVQKWDGMSYRDFTRSGEEYDYHIKVRKLTVGLCRCIPHFHNSQSANLFDEIYSIKAILDYSDISPEESQNLKSSIGG